MGHIELARWADAILIAPATADFMARLANGQADDLLTTLCLAAKAPIALAPAMNQGMWQHAFTQENRLALEQKNIHIFGPGEGSQACGEIGPGRLIEPIEILEKLNALFANEKLGGVNVLITAGPTHEAIDPVRFMTNGSSGKMGYALAQAAREAGANVTLISGPVNLDKPKHINCISVVTAENMRDAVMNHIGEKHIFISVAAVSDYRCKEIASQKMHKDKDNLTLELIRNPDIVSEVSTLKNKPFIVGFAAETENVLEQAKAKSQRKKMDMIIANQVGNGLGMNADDNEVIVLGKEMQTLSRMPKDKLARELIVIIANEYRRNR
jgi:phosphopantothenoylcysteine decarboxylase/phosphopantothenate--cysteine ligase